MTLIVSANVSAHREDIESSDESEMDDMRQILEAS